MQRTHRWFADPGETSMSGGAFSLTATDGPFTGMWF